MLTFIVLFLAGALLLYVLFGGADYGAGILELFKGKKLRDEQVQIIDRAIGPVWEANHIWLILLVVILFTGFPRAYTVITTYLHLPLTLALIGIVLRGTTFTFRHYDAVKDESQLVYSRIFVLSSFITPFWLGVVTGTIASGRIDPGAEDYFSLYVHPWLGVFPIAVGVFCCSLFAFIAAVYLIGETSREEVRTIFVRRAKQLNVSTVVLGGLVLAAGNALEPVSLGLATASLYPLWWAVEGRRVLLSRFLIGFQVTLILVGWYAATFPALIVTSDGRLTFSDLAAPAATLEQLGLALGVGLVLILPSLWFLLRIFKRSRVG